MKKIKGLWFQLLATGTDGHGRSSVARKITRRANLLTAYVALINLVIGVPCSVYLVQSNWLLTGVVTEITLCVLPFYLNHRRHYVVGCMVIYLIMCAANFYDSCLLGSLTKVEDMTIVLCITAFWLFTGWTLRIVNCLLALLLDIGVHLNATHGWIPVLKVDKMPGEILHNASYAVVIFLLVTAAYWYGEVRTYFSNHLKTQHT